MPKRQNILSIRPDLLGTPLLPTIIVFFTLMILIGFSWRSAIRAVNEARVEQVAVRSQFVETSIMQRFQSYDNALRSSAGLFSSSSFVSRNEWRNFVSILNLEERLPAMVGLGYIESVNNRSLAAYLDRFETEGYQGLNLRLNDLGTNSYAVVTYMEPQSERSKFVIGTDVYLDKERSLAMELARDEARTTVTEVIDIIQQADNATRQNGVTIYHPIYRRGTELSTAEGRRSGLVGYIFSPLRADHLFGTIFSNNDDNFNFQVFDGSSPTSDNLLFERYPNNQDNPFIFMEDRTIVVANQSWTIRYSARENLVPESLRERPRSILFGGTVFASAIAALIYLLLQRRARVIASNEEINLQRAKDDLLSLASHQLRTPATGVKQYLGMVLEGFTGKITAEQKTMLAHAYESNERQLRIINEFLYMAKADAGRIIVSPQKINLSQLTKQIVTDMRSDITAANHKVKLNNQVRGNYVHADTHSARMIIENLLSNAIKYTPDGGKISVTIDQTKAYGTVTIADNGVGIKLNDFPKLFKQFSRIPNSLSKQTEGSGIGLYLAKHLAKINGGTIVASSKYDDGSTFTVRFKRWNVKNVTVTHHNKA